VQLRRTCREQFKNRTSEVPIAADFKVDGIPVSILGLTLPAGILERFS